MSEVAAARSIADTFQTIARFRSQQRIGETKNAVPNRPRFARILRLLAGRQRASRLEVSQASSF
jgi:hypothetical protein